MEDLFNTKSSSFSTQCISKARSSQVSSLRSNSCVNILQMPEELLFFEVVAAQLTPKTVASTPVRRETVAKLKVAINGFGRIGRNFLRCWHGREDSPLDLVVVNDSVGVKNGKVKIVDDTTISADGKPIKVVSNRDPLKLLWVDLGIDIVIEGTGVFVDGSGAGKHIQAGAKKVIITAPAKGADIPTYVVGVNEGDYFHEISNIIRWINFGNCSNASCTTNCLAPFVKVMDEELGIVKGTMKTTHSYTGDQLKGKLNGIALHVSTPNVSVVDLVVNIEKKGITAEDVNAAFRKAAEGPLKGILAVCDVLLVSVDFRCSDVSSTIDSSLTMVMGDDMVKVVAWYDNEWGYSQRVVDLAHLVASKWPGMPAAGSEDEVVQSLGANFQCISFVSSKVEASRVAHLIIDIDSMSASAEACISQSMLNVKRNSLLVEFLMLDVTDTATDYLTCNVTDFEAIVSIIVNQNIWT
ncbi:hypothetical protein SLEP1_g51610 [Rubroshorea leprosula]|uniref:Glyceraldehyde 3-phosphate dehydrogenase NAD(P) binding domain-containing protein n=1 Tax=Rubroshorea leprosula TaxID=152421 RepID=A0AAV5M3T6_9ROSI|nr:hypothetical protein SLEP1_g51610 [Rubroshorea leprosula]